MYHNNNNNNTIIHIYIYIYIYIYVMHNLAAHWTEKGDPVDPSRRGPVANPAAPNLPTQNLPTEIA